MSKKFYYSLLSMTETQTQTIDLIYKSNELTFKFPLFEKLFLFWGTLSNNKREDNINNELVTGKPLMISTENL